MAVYQLCYLLTLIFEPRATLPLVIRYVLPNLLYSVWFMSVAGFFVHLLFRCVPGILRIEGRIWQVRFEIVGGHRFALSMDRRQMMRCVPPLCRTGKVVYQERRRDTLLERGWVYRDRFGAWLRQAIGEIF